MILENLEQKTLSILIPIYNEERTVHFILEKVVNVNLIGGYKKEIVLVNDASKDNTEGKIQEFINKYPNETISYYKHEVNQGKGAAIHTGIKKAKGNLIIVQDADLEYDPNEFNILLKPIIDGFADVVYGSRFIGGKPHRILFFFHSIGNKLLTFLCNASTNLNLTDMETCYKLFDAKILKSLSLKENRF
jgi:glycosyltransferase involved in cell wall biosynthesis